VSPAERQLLEEYAEAESIPLAQAARRLIRLGVRHTRSDPEAAPAPDETSRDDFLAEVGMLNLIAAEQLIQLVESITPEGSGAAKAYLIPATRAAQERLAKGTTAKGSAR
jgi:hypothetical protein